MNIKYIKSKLNIEFSKKKFNHFINSLDLKELKTYFDLREIDSEKSFLLFSIISGILLSTIIFSVVNIPLARKNKNLQEDIKSFIFKKLIFPKLSCSTRKPNFKLMI